MVKSFWKEFKPVLSDCLLLGLAISWLVVFVLIWLSPTNYIYLRELNTFIRTVETAAWIGCIGWSSSEIYKKWRKVK